MDLLCDYHHPSRIPLKQWADALLSRLTQAMDGELDYRAIASVANNAALIEAYSGNDDRARQLCESEIAWVSRLSDREHRGYLALAVQPWINLGRLRRIARDPDGGIPHFMLLDAVLSGRTLRLGPCLIGVDDWDKMQSIEPGIVNVIRTVQVVDTVKSYLHAGAYEYLLNQFPAVPAELARTTRLLVREAQLISAASLGWHEQCLRLDSQSLACDVYEDAVMNLHTMESKTALGNMHEVQNAAVLLAALFQERVFDEVAPTTLLRFASRLAYELERLRLLDFATAVSIKGLQIADAVNDEVSRWQSLRSLLRFSPSSPNTQGWQRELDAITGSSEYVMIRMSGNPDGIRPGLDVENQRAKLFRTLSAIFTR